MKGVIRSRIEATPYPRLTILLVGGVLAFGLAGVLTLVDSMVATSHEALAFRLFVLGYLLALFGGAGYVALFVADRAPEP